MVSGTTSRFWHRWGKALHDWELRHFGVRLYRLWLVLLIIALPFLFITGADYFEAMERSGTVGALIADTMMPAMIVSFFVLLYVLKQHRV